VFAEDVNSFSDAITKGKGSLNFRYRFENVDQDGLNKDANASTLRTRINFKSASYLGWYTELEADNITYLGDDKFNNTRNGKPGYPVVADPDGTDLNQAYVGYSTARNKFKFGRQRINLDNQRFIGGVGWRQNEQTYDAVMLSSSPIDKLTVNLAYLDRILRIFGPDEGNPPKDLDSQSAVVNGSYQIEGLGNLTGYGYFLDFENAAPLSSSTIGIRLDGKQNFGDNAFLYTLEYADQEDYGDNPISYSAGYYLVELGLSTPMGTVKGGIETLEGDSGKAGQAFNTPLATLHKFQGWADKFLSTPGAGIDDTYISLGGPVLGTNVALVYHQFDANSGSAEYGSELDFSVAKKINSNFSVLLKYASYDADDFSTDTDKIWLMLTATF
jgi:hypothetical protein